MYGSADGGKTLHNKYKEMNALMKKAGRALNIKSHYIVPVVPPELLKTARRVPICGPGDIGACPNPFPPTCLSWLTPHLSAEGHRGKDNRFYVLDTARVFPPTTPTPGVRGGFLFQLFRPEFVRGYHLPLCSDAFSRYALCRVVYRVVLPDTGFVVTSLQVGTRPDEHGRLAGPQRGSAGSHKAPARHCYPSVCSPTRPILQTRLRATDRTAVSLYRRSLADINRAT